jgi:hypothetical protein
MMTKLVLVQGGVEIPVLQYPLPLKGRSVDLEINTYKIEGKVTAARGRTYTYFAYAGGEFYVAGELGEGPITFKVPEDFKPRAAKTREEMYAVTKATRAAAKLAADEAALAAGEPVVEKPKRVRKAKVEAPAQQPSA